MKQYTQYLLICLLLTSTLDAYSIEKKYPSYSYVFNEFDIDKSYIYNYDFETFVVKNEKKLKNFYISSLKRGQKILPTMKGLLVDEGVSDLFIYLSMVESGFSNSAISPKKAVGLWQFMPATAKNYNLKVCKEYDERCDTSSSTSAAIRYLNKLHRQFGKWYLAVMAYNCGERCVERAIKRAGTDALSVLTDNKLKILPQETREYIKKILLVAMIGENGTLGLNIQNHSDNGLITVDVNGGTNLRDVAKLIKMKYKTLLKLNRKFTQGVLPTRKQRYKINIPIEKVFAFYLRYELISNNITLKPHLVSHYVKLGDTLESIAKKYKTDKKEIIKINNLKDEYLSVEQFLVIPVKKSIFENTLVGTSK